MSDANLAARVERVREKALRLDELLRTEPALVQLAGPLNGLAPPLAEAVVARFERTVRVALPEAYRAYVLEVSGGGLGPNGGLYSIADQPAVTSDEFDESLGPSYALPFSARGEQWDVGYAQGALPLAVGPDLAGDDTAVLLVLSGPERGAMYVQRGAAMTLCQDYRGRPWDFLDWYGSWLDEALRAYVGASTSAMSAVPVVERSGFPARWYAPVAAPESVLGDDAGDDPVEICERLEARGAVEPGFFANPRRAFASPCPSSVPPHLRCPVCKGRGTIAVPLPYDRVSCALVASESHAMRTAEALVYEAAKRLAPWRAKPPARVVWRIVERERIARDLWGTKLPRPCVGAFDAAATALAEGNSPTGLVQSRLRTSVNRALGLLHQVTQEVRDVAVDYLAGSVAFANLAERAKDTDDPDALGLRPDPFAPIVDLLHNGYLLTHLERDEATLVRVAG